jgi:hypothetical protein
MPIVPKHATATADADGDATFAFPDVPQGELWSGTTQVSGAPSTMVGVVTGGAEYFGDVYGPGSYGPWTCGSTQRLIITASGLTPGVQYQAVWHADDKGETYSTYPAPITPVAVSGGGTVDIGNFPPIQEVDGTVDVGNFPTSQAVTGTVTTEPTLAPAVTSGQVTMTGSIVTLPSHVPTQGVVLSTPASNGHAVSVGGPLVTTGTGLILSPGQAPTPVLPVANADELSAIGTSGDVLSWLVT